MSTWIGFSDMNGEHDGPGRREPKVPEENGSLIRGVLLAALIGALVWAVAFWIVFER